MVARILSLDFARGYAVTMRPYLLFVSGVTGIAGLSLAPEPAVGVLLVLSLAFFLSYGFGQALTDCFQMDTDSLSAPYRPLVRGAIKRGDVLTVSLVGLIAIGLVLAFYNLWNIPLAALAVLGLASYTHFKRIWWAGPFYNAWIVVVLLLIGYVAGMGAAGVAATLSPSLLGAAIAVFFGYANFVLTGYYKDVSADRATGYHTLPVVFGSRVSTPISDVFATLAVVGSTLAIYPAFDLAALTTGIGIAIGLLAAGLGAAVLGQARLRQVADESTAHRAVTPVVHAYILLLAAVAAFQQPVWSPALAVFYLGFLIVMARRPMREQI